MIQKKKYNLIGGGFNHYQNGNKASSIFKQESKFIEWVNSGAEETFYVDQYINLAFDDDVSTKKYAWLLESKSICPEIIEDINNQSEDLVPEFMAALRIFSQKIYGKSMTKLQVSHLLSEFQKQFAPEEH